MITGAFARDDVPLFGRGDEHLRLHNFRFGELHVAGQLFDLHPQSSQSFAKVVGHFCSQGFHRSNIHNLIIKKKFTKKTLNFDKKNSNFGKKPKNFDKKI